MAHDPRKSRCQVPPTNATKSLLSFFFPSWASTPRGPVSEDELKAANLTQHRFHGDSIETVFRLSDHAAMQCLFAIPLLFRGGKLRETERGRA